MAAVESSPYPRRLEDTLGLFVFGKRKPDEFDKRKLMGGLVTYPELNTH